MTREIYHFKAIEMLCSFVQDCSLLNHFLSSYQKNYTPNLESIEEAENTLEESRREYSDLGLSRSSLQERDLFRKGSKPKTTEVSDYHTQMTGKYARRNKEKEINDFSKENFSKVSLMKVAKKPISIGTNNPIQVKNVQHEENNQGYLSSQDQIKMKDQNKSKNQIGSNLNEKQGKVKTITRQAVQRILDGINLQKGGLNNIVTIQGLKTAKEGASKNCSKFGSKKNSTNIISLGDSQRGSRANSRKSTSTKSKGTSPLPSPAHASHTGWCQNSQPLNIKIENKDFIAKLMNINIIKIKPDLKNNACFCKAFKDKQVELISDKKKSVKGQSTSVECKSKDGQIKGKSSNLRNRSTSERSNDQLSKRRQSKNKKLGLFPSKLPLTNLEKQKYV